MFRMERDLWSHAGLGSGDGHSGLTGWETFGRSFCAGSGDPRTVSLLVNACAGAGDSSTVCGSLAIGVEPSNFKIGLGVGSEVDGADAANFEVGTPDPGLLTLGMYVRLGGQVGQMTIAGQLFEVPVKKGFCD